MNFAAAVDAYTNRFSAPSKLVLREGAIEFDPPLPSADIALFATSAAVVVQVDLHPGLVSLLTHALIHNPKSDFDKSGDPVLFYKSGEFPWAHDPEFRFSSEAHNVHKSGESPTHLASLHLSTSALVCRSRSPPCQRARRADHSAVEPSVRHRSAAYMSRSCDLCLEHSPAFDLLVPASYGVGAGA